MGIRHTFIQNLKHYRKEAGLTQEKLAEAIGMSTAYIGSVEACERFPSPETIDKIAGAVGVMPSTLFLERGSPQSAQEAFVQNYGHSLQQELSKRILKDIDDVCRLL